VALERAMAASGSPPAMRTFIDGGLRPCAGMRSDTAKPDAVRLIITASFEQRSRVRHPDLRSRSTTSLYDPALRLRSMTPLYDPALRPALRQHHRPMQCSGRVPPCVFPIAGRPAMIQMAPVISHR